MLKAVDALIICAGRKVLFMLFIFVYVVTAVSFLYINYYKVKGESQSNEEVKNLIGGVYTNNITLFFRNSPYRVRSDVIVEKRATLTIETGVQIHFDTGVGLKIKGTIKAVVSVLIL